MKKKTFNLDKKDWLESLYVNTEGEIITPDRRASTSVESLYKKRQEDGKKRKEQLNKHDVAKERSKIILQKK